MDSNKNPETKNLKLTRNRHAVLSAMDTLNNPVTAEDIYEQIKENGQKVSLSTVYRALEFLASNGIIKKTVLDSQKAIYEIDTLECTHHLVCEKCSKIIIIHECPIHKNQEWNQIAKANGFEISRHKLEIYGRCSDCHKPV